MSDLYIGVYKHYKGGLYRVLLTALDAEDHQTEVVVYMCMQRGTYHTRKRSDWEKPVKWPNGKMCNRFIPFLA